MKKRYVQYGCGLTAPVQWENYDVSPTLRIQKIPILGRLLRGRLNAHFPDNVRFGNIIKGLPVEKDSCDGVYCSHTLEHLSLADFRKALKNTYLILKPNGIFRCVVPDLEWAARKYVHSLDKGESAATLEFFADTRLGAKKRPRGPVELLSSFFGNSDHLWMWDHRSLSEELMKAGFVLVRSCEFNDCPDEMFRLVEDRGRFYNAVAVECRK
jgi:SAM-dependent methyltransferase